MEEIKIIGQMEGYEVINRVYSDEGICPTINTCGGGGHQPKILEINTVTVPQTVRVRKYQVDIEKLKECLRSHKNKTNKEIAEHLNIPITKVEHWFRADSSFSIPDEEHWHKLKDLLEIKTEEFDKSIMTFEEREGVYDKGERLYIPNGIAPTLTVAGGDRIIETQIVAMRGRDPENPSDRTPGNPNLVQTLEPNSEGIANTLTTVQKDNMVLELGHIEKGTGKHQSNVVYSENGCSPTICASYGVKQPPAMHVEVRQATKQGSIPCEIGGVADLNYPTSKTRRGRVQGNGQISPTLTTENIPSVLEPWIWEIDGVQYLIRIRKLTPKECWRLMDFKDEDFEKAAAVNSNTQLYKQAGNSIVKNVLCEVFKQLIE